VWDVAQRRQIDAFADVHDPHIWRWLACSHDGRWLAAVQAGDVVVVFDCETLDEAHRWQFDEAIDGRAHFALSPDGRRFAIAHSPRLNHVALYERDHPGPRRLIPAMQCASVAFSPDGRSLAIEQQNEVLLYPLEHEGEPRVLKGATNTIQEIAFSPDGILLASVSHDRTLKVWRHATGELLFSVVAHRGRAMSVDVSPDGRTIATAGDDGQVRLWHTATGQPLGAMPQEQCITPRVRFTQDGLRLISAGLPPYATVYDAAP
jgi:WD40 repeat protein